MRVDPRARPRLVGIIHNLRDRIKEARDHGWLGEVDGLQTSLAGCRLPRQGQQGVPGDSTCTDRLAGNPS